MTDTEIKLLDNGPILLNGEWKIVDGAGKLLASSETTPQAALCRCGASAKKPHCDGAHKKSGFKSR